MDKDSEQYLKSKVKGGIYVDKDSTEYIHEAEVGGNNKYNVHRLHYDL